MFEIRNRDASEDDQTNNQTGKQRRNRHKFNCPTCDRPTLEPAADEIVTWGCGCCGQRVTEIGGEA
jgi:ribosomal protein L37AE/L43A